MIEIWQQNVDQIRKKRVFWGRHDSDELRNYSWDKLIDMVDTHSQDDYDWNREKQRLGLNAFHRRGSAPKFAHSIVTAMEKFFIDDHKDAHTKEEYDKGPQQITNIAFCGFGQYSGSYPRHKDSMDVFLYQVLNKCKITIGYTEEPSDDDMVEVLHPGSFVWIPRGTWHQLEPDVSRVTFSFGVEGDTDPATYV
jgi:mannose-6-phosphate isomerase-like protein (cupin superfamily)